MEKKIEIIFPTDKYGLTGRKCHECGWYFKVKHGTGLPTAECICPYCGHVDSSNEFLTTEQEEYVKSYIAREILGPELKKIAQSLKNIERSTRGEFLQIKVTTTGLNLPLKYYSERDLETQVTCDCCGLEFAIYGVFASCPDCGRLNALTVLNKSMEVERKKLLFIEKLASSETALVEAVLSDVLSGAVSAFDGFGKALRAKYSGVFPENPKNLFQNLTLLSNCLELAFGMPPSVLIGDNQFKFLLKWFQVRHLYEHSMGVVDKEFVSKVDGSDCLKGKKYPLDREEIEKVLDGVEQLAGQIMAKLSKAQ